jgi:hypothetical protein
MTRNNSYGSANGGLCHRCEERALFLEGGKNGRPRAECGHPTVSKHACYCYRPVRPILLVPVEGDDRPVEAGTIQCARTRRTVLMRGEILGTWQEDGLAMWWKADPYRSKDAHKPTKHRKGGRPMIRKIAIVIVMASMMGVPFLQAGVEEGKAALRRNDHEAAYKEFLPLAKNGDVRAMMTIGMMHYNGEGVPQDYAKAMDWFVLAYKEMDGDAFNNIGVMYRDGLGVPKNKKIAYVHFLLTHVGSLGDESTQIRANSNLRRILPEMTREELVECFNYTVEYLNAYVESRGKLKGIPDNCRRTKDRPAIRDLPLWMKGELDFLEEAPAKK